MAETPKIVNYFFVTGLPEKTIEKEPITRYTKPKLPITDIVVINRTQGEATPKGFECLELTPTNFPANLNHGSLVSPEMYICVKRGRDSPPVIDIGVYYQSSKKQLRPGVEMITSTPYGRSANVNNTVGEKIYITFCRAIELVDWDTLAVCDICIILPSKGEAVPHAFRQINKPLNLGMIGSDVYLCYRKSYIKNKCLTYDAGELLFRYPTTDDPNFPLPQQLPMFCLPQGAAIERWGANSRYPLPVYSTFVLTDQSGLKCYGAAVVFYKDFNSKYFTQKQREFFGDEKKNTSSVHTKHKQTNKQQSICLLSRWPFFDSFKKFLLYLYRISVSGPQGIPIERYISHFIDEIPFPSPERPYISIHLSTEEITIMLPDESPLTKSGASYSKFLLNLGPENCISILLYVLMEHKIVIHSLRPDLLTCVAETASTMIFPFQWQCPYVPLCPLQLSDVVDSPTPFIIGLDSSYFDSNNQPPDDITYVDLDAQSISLSKERSSDTLKLLPKKPLRRLRTSLEQLYDGLINDPSCPSTPSELDSHGGFNIRDALNQQNQRKMDAQIQECFLLFMADIMKGYSSYLRPVSNYSPGDVINISGLFDVQGFLKSHDKSYGKLLSQLIRTQYFCRFLEERSLGSCENVSLTFFDACLDKLKSDPNAALIEVEEMFLSERTAVISFLDNVQEIPNVSYSYNSFSDLDLKLFSMTLHNVKYQKTTKTIKNDSLFPFTASAATPSSLLPTTANTSPSLSSSSQFMTSSSTSTSSAARCLLWVTYSIWFTLLPAFIRTSTAKKLLLSIAHKSMVDFLKRGGRPLDEVLPYKIFFQLCGIYNEPRYANDVYNQMISCNIRLDVATYGYYNSVSGVV
ncbi:hypothetical protein HELRODRAFT_77102 [Helobdella robusta]|uniref:UDENN domain-containing protein n=1 Tax=Helobdella robusta TaxID=6412 RepID=T1G2T2_HELRO|nr:hypothetical protein HELRODRAFT_77102 [Helobdella robusta]ESO07026.1 hypothetical protein HELRODRAFT_77102 [Helobdella robusta]